MHALFIAIDPADTEAQERARAALPPSRTVTLHAIPQSRLDPLRAVLRGAEREGPPPLPHPDSSPRAGKGGRCAVCASGRRDEVERYLALGHTARAVERMLEPGPSDNSIRRHAVRCMRAQ